MLMFTLCACNTSSPDNGNETPSEPKTLDIVLIAVGRL